MLYSLHYKMQLISLSRFLSHIEEGGGCVGIPPPDEIDGDNIDDLSNKMDAMQIQGNYL